MSKDYVQWKAQIARTIPHERRFTKKLINLFSRQEKEVLSKTKKVNLSSVTTKQIEKAKSKEQIIIDQIDIDKKKWNGIFTKETIPLFEALVEDAGQDTIVGLVTGIDFDSEDIAVREFIKDKTIKFSGFVNGETSKRLNRAIKPILEVGGSVEDVRRKIQEAVRSMFESSVRGMAPRARMIARTEMVGSANGASLLAMDQSGVVAKKSWIPSFDARVRETHRDAGRRYPRGKGIALDKNFTVGNATLKAPGNLVSGDVGESINCRCVIVSSGRRRRR